MKKQNGIDSRGRIRMNLNENAWGPSPAARRALRNMGVNDLAFYPDPRRTAEATAAFHRVRPENVLLTNGADDAIHAAVRALVPPGGKILIPAPSFNVYENAARLCRARVETVLYKPDLAYPGADVLARIRSGIRMIVVVTPNNPTGTVASRTDLEKTLLQAGAIPVVVDETYALFEGLRHGGLLRRHPNLIVIGSFSKFFGLAGLRLGYALSSPEIIAKLRNAIPEYPVNAAALVAAEAAMKDRAYQKKILREAAVQKRYLREGLSRLGVEVFPGGGNFFVIRIGPAAEKVAEGLRESGILVKDISRRPLLDGCLRVTVGKKRDNDRFLNAIKKLLPPQAVLFDMDGVLVDVRESCRKTIQAVIERFLKRPVPMKAVDDYKFRRGLNNDWDLVGAFLRERGIRVSRAATIRVFQEIYFGENGDGLISRESWISTRDLLVRLSGRYKLGIVTGRPRAEALFTLNKFAAAGFFSVLIGMEDTGRKPKPDPCGILLAMRKLGVRRAAYVGDIPDDMRAGRGAGAFPVAVLPASGADKENRERKLRKAGAEEIIPSIARIEEILP